VIAVGFDRRETIASTRNAAYVLSLIDRHVIRGQRIEPDRHRGPVAPAGEPSGRGVRDKRCESSAHDRKRKDPAGGDRER